MTWMPQAVQGWCRDIERGTGQAPQVERVGDRRFRLTVENERVLMTVDFKTTGPGRWVWAGSTLTVDGVRRPLAENAAAFYRLFHDPDSGGKRRVDPADEEPFEPYPLDDPPPPPVRQLMDQLTAQLGRKLEATITAGRLGDGTPLVVITVPRGYLRVRVGAEVTMRAVLDGYDETGSAKESLADVLRRLIEAHDPATPAPPPVARPRPSTRSNSVEVRRQSVIRT